jgi:sugar lactone lactonase YvrE
MLLPLAVALTAATALHAQAVSFASAQTIVLDSGLFFPTGVAVNGAGDVFIADLMNNRVVKLSSTGVQSTVGSGLKNPQGVALDAAGNVLIADTFNDRVLKISPSGAQTTVLDGLNRPTGVAVDGAGNIFIADLYRNRVLRVSTNGAQTAVGSGLTRPTGVAVDGAGNVFIADSGNNRVVKVSSAGAQTLVTDRVAEPNGVVADGAGNVFIADTNNNRILKVSAIGALTDLEIRASHPHGVAVDAAGILFVADSDNNRVLETQPAAVDFAAVNICPSGQSSPAPCSRSLTLKYNIATAGALGTPAVFTQGAPDLDFKLGASNCAGDVTGGASCSVDVTFVPSAPGARLGAVELTDAGGKVLVTTPIYGQGRGAAISFGPGTQTTLAGGPTGANGVAVDGAGNVFIAEFTNNRVLKVSPGGARTEVGTGLRLPNGVAVDGAGDIFIADTGNNRVVKVRARSGEQTTVADGLYLPQGVAVDGAGNLFIADYSNNRVVKVAAGSGARTLVGIGLKLPYGVAVDAAGNVFIADYDNDRVVKVSPKGGQSDVAHGLNFPSGVAVDAAGNVFIVDSNNHRVLEVPADGAPPTTIGAGLSRPLSVAVDAAGNIFIGDNGTQSVVQVQRSLPPALDFGATVVGGSTGPQNVVIRNIGNQDLNAMTPGLTIPANYQLCPGGTSPIDCNAGFRLRPGQSCDLNISFAPQSSGDLQAAAVLTDNAMNGAPATQTINLSGSGVLPTTTTVQAAAGVYSDQVTLTAVVGPSGLTFAGSLQFRVGTASLCSVAVTGSGTYSCNYTIALAASSYTLNGELTSSDSSVQGSSSSNKLTVAKEDSTITPSTLNPASVPVNTNGLTAPFYLRGTVQQTADGSPGDLTKALVLVKLVSATTSISCPAGVTSGGQLNALCRNVPVGTYQVQWSTGQSSYYQAPSVNTALTVTQ